MSTELTTRKGPRPATTLDELWEGAERLGRIEVDRPFGAGDYRVTIRFSTALGSTIYARGESVDIREALHRAIHEALSLGAKPR